jgi:hypothetical protein
MMSELNLTPSPQNVENRLRENVAAVLVFALIPLLFVGAAFLPGKVLLPLDLKADFGAWKPDPAERRLVSNRLMSDVVVQFHPWDLEARRLLRAGQMPWRNQYAGEGGPLWANPQTALLSPFTAPRLMLGARGWAISVYLKFFLAGIGVWLLLQLLNYPAFIAAVCGIVYMCCGYSVLYALHPHTNVFAVLPLLAAAAVAFLRKRTAARALLVTLAAAVATAGGHPETLFIGVIAVAVMLLVARDRLQPRPWVRLAVAALAGFLLLGVLLVPFALVARHSDTAASRPATPAGAFRLVALPGQLLPGFLGTPVADELDLTAMLPNAENMNLRSGGFVGVIALVTMLLAFRGLPKRDRLLLIIGGAFLFLSLRPPGIASLLKKLPILSVVAPEYFALAFVFLCLIPLASSLQLLQQRGPARKLGIAVLVLALLASAAALALAAPVTRNLTLTVARRGIAYLQQRGHFQQAPEVYEQRLDGYLARGRVMFVRRFALPALAWALAGAALMARKHRTAMLGCAMALEVLVFGWHLLPVVQLDQAPHAPASIQFVLRTDPARQWTLAAPPEIYPANLGTEDRVRQADSYDVLQSKERVHALRRAGFDPLTGFPSAPNEQQLLALRELGVRFFLSRNPLPNAPRIGGDPPPGVGVYEIRDAIPTALPANARPEGWAAGCMVTLAGAILAAWQSFGVR